MGYKGVNRIIAIIAIASLLFCHFAPMVAMANFIKPGNAITPGEAISPGEPISGGQFIIPGRAYKPGEAISDNGTLTSGQPILPGPYLDTGAFLIPNAPPAPPGMLYWQLKGIETGTAITGGNIVDGGQGPNGGNAVNGGQGPNDGNAVDGGQGPNGGNAVDRGQGPNGGSATDSGQVPDGGSATDGGQVPDGGSATDGGQVPDGGSATDGGQVPDSGNAGEVGKGPDAGNTGSGGQALNRSSANPSVNWTMLENMQQTTKDAKTWLISRRNNAFKMLDGTLSMVAGFQIKDLNTHIGNRNLHEIMGKKNLTSSNNPVAKWLNSRYQNYLQSFNDSKTILRNGELRTGTQKKAKHMASFFKENFSLKSTLKTIGDDFSKNWNPFANPFNSNNKGFNKVFNKNFFNLKNMAKGNGLVNIIASSGNRIIDYAKDPKKSFISTDFAAGITTDVSFGVGSTAISAGVGWGAAAATGAAFGSVVPGLGTLVGAGVGIGLSFALASPGGRRFKGAVEKGVKKVYDGLVNLGSSLKDKVLGIFG